MSYLIIHTRAICMADRGQAMLLRNVHSHALAILAMNRQGLLRSTHAHAYDVYIQSETQVTHDTYSNCTKMALSFQRLATTFLFHCQITLNILVNYKAVPVAGVGGDHLIKSAIKRPA